MFTANKKELIDVYNNIVERYTLNDENYFMYPDSEFRISVDSDGVFLIWYYPKEIERNDKNLPKICFQYKFDLCTNDGKIEPNYVIHYEEPAFYDSNHKDAELNYGESVVIKNKKLIMTITQRMSTYDNADDAYKAFLDWHDKIRKDALKARIKAI